MVVKGGHLLSWPRSARLGIGAAGIAVPSQAQRPASLHDALQLNRGTNYDSQTLGASPVSLWKLSSASYGSVLGHYPAQGNSAWIPTSPQADPRYFRSSLLRRVRGQSWSWPQNPQGNHAGQQFSHGLPHLSILPFDLIALCCHCQVCPPWKRRRRASAIFFPSSLILVSRRIW